MLHPLLGSLNLEFPKEMVARGAYRMSNGGRMAGQKGQNGVANVVKLG
jgi:hypothetical protein